MWSSGRDKVCSILTLRIVKSNPGSKICMCVECLVANLILLCSLKYISLLWNIFCENMCYLYSHFFFFFSFLLWTSFVSIFYILHNPCLFLQQLLREILSRTWSIYSDKTQQTNLSFPSVGAEHFEVDEKHVFAYFQYRSITYMWRIRDLDLGNMINLSTRVNKT